MTIEQEPTPARPDRWRRRLVGPFTVAQVAAVAVAIVFTGVALVVLTAPLGRPEPTPPRPGSGLFVVGSPEPGLQVGQLAPDFIGDAGGQPIDLKDLDGNPIRLADLRGRPVWVNFWATWCPPCQAETPVLRDVYNEFKDDGLALVAVSVQETTAEDVRAYVERYDLDYTVGFDATSAIFHAYHAFVLPTQFFIDREGVIRDVRLGQISRDAARSIVANLLGAPPSAPSTSSPAASPRSTN